MKLSTSEVTLIGFVGGDAQAKETKNHNKYAVVSLATSDSWKDKDSAWQKRSTWHRLVGWQAIGDSMVRNLTKGSFIQVRGSIRNYEVPAKDGQGTRTLTEIVVTGFAKLDRARRRRRRHKPTFNLAQGDPTMNITLADIDSLDSVIRRAEDDWSAYYQSGYGPKDFPTRQEWRQHVRTVNSDLNRVRKLMQRASREFGGRS